MKNKQGITLIALVITIIVLLILAAVAISFVTSGGLIDRARDGKEKQVKAEAYEKFATTAASTYTEFETGNITASDYASKLGEALTKAVSGFQGVSVDNQLQGTEVGQFSGTSTLKYGNDAIATLTLSDKGGVDVSKQK